MFSWLGLGSYAWLGPVLLIVIVLALLSPLFWDRE